MVACGYIGYERISSQAGADGSTRADDDSVVSAASADGGNATSGGGDSVLMPGDLIGEPCANDGDCAGGWCRFGTCRSRRPSAGALGVDYDLVATTDDSLVGGGGLALPVWRADGLEILDGSSGLLTQPSAHNSDLLLDAMRGSNAYTIEAWVTLTRLSPIGGAPGRIIALNGAWNDIVFDLGHFDEGVLSARWHDGDSSGTDHLYAPFSSLELDAPMQLVVTVQGADGRFYRNGVFIVERSDTEPIEGPPQPERRVHLGNEFSDPRPFVGIYHRVAIYDRALSEAEVADNFGAGF